MKISLMTRMLVCCVFAGAVVCAPAVAAVQHPSAPVIDDRFEAIDFYICHEAFRRICAVLNLDEEGSRIAESIFREYLKEAKRIDEISAVSPSEEARREWSEAARDAWHKTYLPYQPDPWSPPEKLPPEEEQAMWDRVGELAHPIRLARHRWNLEADRLVDECVHRLSELDDQGDPDLHEALMHEVRWSRYLRRDVLGYTWEVGLGTDLRALVAEATQPSGELFELLLDAETRAQVEASLHLYEQNMGRILREYHRARRVPPRRVSGRLLPGDPEHRRLREFSVQLSRQLRGPAVMLRDSIARLAEAHLGKSSADAWRRRSGLAMSPEIFTELWCERLIDWLEAHDPTPEQLNIAAQFQASLDQRLAVLRESALAAAIDVALNVESGTPPPDVQRGDVVLVERLMTIPRAAREHVARFRTILRTDQLAAFDDAVLDAGVSAWGPSIVRQEVLIHLGLLEEYNELRHSRPRRPPFVHHKSSANERDNK